MIRERIDWDTVLDEAGVLIYCQDAKGRIYYGNRLFRKLVLSDDTSFSEKSISACMQGEDWKSIAENEELVKKYARGMEFEETIQGKDGTKHFISYRTPRFQNGEFTGFLNVLTDITERVVIEWEQQSLIEELASQNAKLQQLFSILSHDMRTPIVNIVGFGERLKTLLEELENETMLTINTESKPEAMQQKLKKLPSNLQYILSNAKKMDRMIQAVLKIARNSQWQCNTEPVDVKALFTRVMDSSDG